MGLAFALAAAAVATVAAWPASAIIRTLTAGREPLSADPAAADSAAADSAPGRPPGRDSERWQIVTLAAGMAAAALAVALSVRPALVVVAGCWLVICGGPLAVLDLRVRRLPDVLTAAALIGITATLVAAAAASGSWSRLGQAAAAGVLTGAFFALLAVARPGSAGLGDAKLALSTGTLAGWFGWAVLLASLLAGFVLAAGCGLTLVAASRRRTRGTSVPFGPFLIAGCLIMVILAGRPGLR